MVTDYLKKSGLDKALDKLQFNLVGYGCTTCIGNSGLLPEEISKAVNDNDLVVCSVLSGNRNFEGRINPDTRANYLASPPLVVAYALAGRMDVDLTTEPLGRDADGEPVYLSDIWPSSEEIEVVADAIARTCSRRATAMSSPATSAGGRSRCRRATATPGPTQPTQKPAFFEGMDPEPEPVEPIAGARVLAVLGDSVTTDHISPAGAIKKRQPRRQVAYRPGRRGEGFQLYGSRRGNHEVMIRGTFANVRSPQPVGREGGRIHPPFPDGEETTIYEAAMRYADDGVPLVVLAGKEYGSGSSRLGREGHLAARRPRGDRGELRADPPLEPDRDGVLPLQFPDGESIESWASPVRRPSTSATSRTGGEDRHGDCASRRRRCHVRGNRPDRHPERGDLLPERRILHRVLRTFARVALPNARTRDATVRSARKSRRGGAAGGRGSTRPAPRPRVGSQEGFPTRSPPEAGLARGRVLQVSTSSRPELIIHRLCARCQ